MKYLIVGLGNPGEKYEHTRHNVGFKVLDSFVKEQEGKFEVAKLGDVSRVKFKGRTIVCLKPSTFMNLSGKAVNYWMQSEKIPVENVLVITKRKWNLQKNMAIKIIGFTSQDCSKEDMIQHTHKMFGRLLERSSIQIFGKSFNFKFQYEL